MPDKCPLCGQSLPHALKAGEIQSRIEKLSSASVIAERRKLEKEFEARQEAAVQRTQEQCERQFKRELKDAEQLAEKRALAKAQQEVKKQISDAEKRADAAEARGRLEVERARKEAIASARRDVDERLRIANLQNEARLEKLQNERERDRIRHETERAKDQRTVDELSRRLERQSGEQLGSEAERELFLVLKEAFPNDRFERIGRAVKGADIVHFVMDGSKEVGKIIYESKSTSTWLNEFIVQAKKYRAQYETPHVMVVTRVFPKKQRGFCVERDVPIVEPRMAVPLATVLRDGIIAISKLRLSANAHDEKSIELYHYIVGDKFCTRFREMSESIEALRAQQQSERKWHENQWETESRLHERLASRHREVDSHINAICGTEAQAERTKMPARSESWTSRPHLASAR